MTKPVLILAACLTLAVGALAVALSHIGEQDTDLAALKVRTAADSTDLEATRQRFLEAQAKADALEHKLAADAKTHRAMQASTDSARQAANAVTDDARRTLADSAATADALRRSLSAEIIAREGEASAFSRERSAAEARILTLETALASRDSANHEAISTLVRCDTLTADLRRQVAALEQDAHPSWWRRTLRAGGYVLVGVGVAALAVAVR